MLPLSAQMNSSESGSYPIQNFNIDSYEGHYQNWSVIVDQNGFVYAANGDGLLEFDGESWRLITKPGLRAVRRVVVDQYNRKWVGADRDLGYLDPDSLGFLQFRSLKEKIPKSHPLDGSVWKVFPLENKVLFFTDSTIYKWTDKKFSVIPCEGGIHREFMINDMIYLRRSGKGLFILGDDDSIQLAPGGELFKDIPIHVMLPYTKNTILMGSKPKGLFLYDGKNLKKFENDLNEFFDKNILYSGLLLPDSTYAFSTLRDGIVFMNRDGKRIKHITESSGILTNQVHGFALDQQNALWLALQTGLSRIEPNLPYTFFDKKSGLQGTVSAIVQHKGTLYVGTFGGLFKLNIDSSNNLSFQKIDNIASGCFSLLSTDEGLLAATAAGTFLVSDNQVAKLSSLVGSRHLYRLKSDSMRVFIGHMGGLASIHLNNGHWEPAVDHPEIVEDIFSVVEGDPGVLWLNTSLHNIIRIEIPKIMNHGLPLDLSDAKISHFDERHGLPKGVTNLFVIDGEVVVNSTGQGGPCFKFDPKAAAFVATDSYGSKFGLDSLVIYPLNYQDDGQHVLLSSKPINGKVYQFSASRNPDSGHYSVQRVFNERFRSTTENKVYWRGNRELWFGGESVVTKYDLSVKPKIETSFQTYIRKVTIRQDSVLFGGDSQFGDNPLLSYNNNELRFEFASPSFTGPKTIRYQYLLQGFDSDWSDWTFETKKDYTNIPEGGYQFQVRAQNVYGYISKQATFSFQIAPPWHRTWWAYSGYLMVIIGMLTALFRWRASKLRAEKEALEVLVMNRTEKVQEQSKQLKKQAEKLQELDRVKSRFFANISHEFRTPLTLIIGPLQDFLKGTSKINGQEVGMMHRNAVRLQKLINQLLDLSKIESGKLKLNVSKGNLYRFLRAVLSSFSSLAAQRNIQFDYAVPEQIPLVFFDEDKLEKIINNLISNAFKYTHEFGKISVEVAVEKDTVTIKVIDNGPGIPENQLEVIFDRFIQLDSSNTREQEGTGIGLALTKELVQLCHGTITVESVLDKGSTFIVSIPINEQSFDRSEITKTRLEDSPLEISSDHFQPEIDLITSESQDERPIVLVVEDQSELRYYIAKHLREFKVLEATNGAEGLETAITQIPDLIISDIMMPKMDGIQLLEALKTNEKTSHIPIVLLTAKADLSSRLEGLETGADDYLTKPFDATELVIRSKNLIEQRKALRKMFSKSLFLEPKKIAITSTDELFLNKVMRTVEKYLDDSSFTVEVFQREVGMSRMQLHRKLKALTDHSATEFIRIQRLKSAAQQLTDSDASISEICYRVGFNSLSYFTKSFKAQYGVTPSEYSINQQT